MKRSLIQILTLLALFMLISASDQPENKSEKSTDNRITLAVAPPRVISTDKDDSSLGPVLGSFLIDEMNKSTTFKVIDLEMSDQVEKLLAFANSDKCDQTQCHIAVGNLIPASKLLASTLARLGDKYTMSARLIDIKKGVVEFSAKEQMSGKKDDLDQLTQLVAIDIRQHFGEKIERPKPLPQPQPQASAPANTPQAPAYPYETLDSKNPLGIVVGDLSQSEKKHFSGVKVISVSPDSPCKDIFQPGNIISELKPQGQVSHFWNAEDKLFMISSTDDFRKLVASIRPGASVGFMTSPGQSIWQSNHFPSCIIPYQSR